MTREDKPATLADQAASWVPPWARQPEPEPEPAGPGGSAVDVASADVAGAATEDAEPMAGEEMAAGEAAAVEAAGPHGESGGAAADSVEPAASESADDAVPVAHGGALAADAETPAIDEAVPAVEEARLVEDDAAAVGGDAEPADDAVHFVDRGAFAADAEAVAMDEAVPAVEEARLVEETRLAVGDAAPVAGDGPAAGDTVWPTDGSALIVAEVQPIVEGTARLIGEAGPAVGEAPRVVDQARPTMGEAPPVVDEAAPVVDEPVPTVDEAVPATDDALPATDEALPATDEAFSSAADAAAPVVDEALPADTAYSAAEQFGAPDGQHVDADRVAPDDAAESGLDDATDGLFEVPAEPIDLGGPLEAILMIVDEPVSEVVLAQVLDQPTERVVAALRELAAGYAADVRGFELRKIAGGWRFYTRGEFAPYVERFVLDGQQVRLTQAALETLAVIAYKQPVTRSRISAIRGVNCDGVVRTLMSRGLIEECGSEPDSGAFLYRTTTLFLEKLGLNSVDELPPLAPFLPDDVDEIANAQG